jgi:hypothetical protein
MQADLEAERVPSLSGMYWEAPVYNYEDPEPVDVDKNAYKRISELEKNIHEMRLTITQIYKHLTEGTDINSKVQLFRDKTTVEEIRDKDADAVIARGAPKK